MTMKILDHFFPIISSTGGKSDDSFFVPFILAGADDLWWSSSSFINYNNNNNTHTCIIKAPKGRVPENRGKLPSVVHGRARVWVQAIAVSPGDSRVHVPRRRLYQPKRHRG